MIFVSHSRQDQAMAADLETALRARGATTWADFSRIPIGERFVEEIAGALRQCSVFLLVSSAASACSYWVSREVACASRLRAFGILDSLVQLDLDGTVNPEWRFDYRFDRIADAVEHAIKSNQDASPDRARLDSHRVDISYYHPRPSPRVWLGFSSELAALDTWFLGAGAGLWVSALGGAGKSSLASVWITALRMIGYQHPLNVSIQQWDFYEAPDVAAVLERIHSWVDPAGQATQLLFLDGMDELSEPPVRELLELGSRYPSLKILVTSRQLRPQQFSSTFQVLSLQSLDRTHAQLLATRLGICTEDAERLFNLLEGHPLAVSLAAGLVERGYDIEEIFGRLEPE